MDDVIATMDVQSKLFEYIRSVVVSGEEMTEEELLSENSIKQGLTITSLVREWVRDTMDPSTFFPSGTLVPGKRLSFDIGRKLGSGNSEVMEVMIRKIQRKTFALKFFPHTDDQVPMRFIREIHSVRILSKHTNIPSYFGAWVDTDQSYVLYELYKTTLYSHVKSNGPLRKTHYVRHMTSELLNALVFSHVTHGIAHRDIKPRNILLSNSSVSSFHVVLADWDSSSSSATRRTSLDDLGDFTTNPVCTLPYRSPEFVEATVNESLCAFRLDMWSLGCVLYFAATGNHLFQGGSEEETKQNIIRWKDNDRWPDPKTIERVLGERGENLLRRLLKKEPKQRIMATEAIFHPFITLIGGDMWW